ncbi:MAG: diacylglycerol kinase [Nitrospirae bacterium]|jgi:diacylglycerol kinase (ATP)|nr:diacylglycerol kinase [Nitrospirota bacterium]MCL5063026.1 diacylglycerol kinase [Nitrospirota bacterium]MDA8215639.1 diacylglycerol kinase [Nitrospiraceae bacterium]MDA8338778.1 diacylglycerol kinase [Nitrospiraceae bacterium]
MPLRKWIDSTNNAIEGILHAAKTQRHLRYHFYSAVAVLVLSYILGVERTDFLIISIAVILVLLAEMFNTAIEYVVDMLSPEHSEKARVAKDVAAGAVLITAFGAAVLGYIILFPYFSRAFEQGIDVAKHSKEEITLIAVILVLIIVVVLKAYSGKGHPLRGGMPSGHSAIAFSAWVAVTYITESFIASLLSFLLSVLIAQSRIAVKAHSPFEVVAGAVLGAGLTLLLFLIFY